MLVMMIIMIMIVVMMVMMIMMILRRRMRMVFDLCVSDDFKDCETKCDLFIIGTFPLFVCHKHYTDESERLRLRL